MLTSAEKLLEELSNTSKDFIIIVEGIRDEKSLKELGITRVARLNKGVHELAEKLAEMNIKKAVILTDFDRKGEELAKKIRSALLALDIRVLDELRKNVRSVFGVCFIENLSKIVERGDVHGEDIHRFRKVYNPRSDRCGRKCGKAGRYRGSVRANRRASWRRT